MPERLRGDPLEHPPTPERVPMSEEVQAHEAWQEGVNTACALGTLFLFGIFVIALVASVFLHFVVAFLLAVLSLVLATVVAIAIRRTRRQHQPHPF